MKYKIPFIKPIFPSPGDFIESYKEMVESNWFTNFGPFEQRLCDEVATFLGGDVSVATASNATLALDISIKALFVRPNDKQKKEVIVPSFTFAAGPEMIINNGFTPVFIDIEQMSLQPDLQQAKKYIKQNQAKIAGILLCNIFGIGNERIADWEELAKSFDLPLIIDSAAGFGSKYTGNEYIGARGDCEIFSMHATKPFSVGEGGLIVSRNEKLIVKIRSIENFGFNAQREIGYIGTNAKLQELSCAIGLLQLKNFKNRLLNRQISLKYYKKKLEGQGYYFPNNDENSTVAFVSVLAPTEEMANNAYQRLTDSGIDVRKYYLPLHTQRILTDNSVLLGEYAVTEDVSSRILSLPLHDDMDKETVNIIVGIVKNE